MFKITKMYVHEAQTQPTCSVKGLSQQRNAAALSFPVFIRSLDLDFPVRKHFCLILKVPAATRNLHVYLAHTPVGRRQPAHVHWCTQIATEKLIFLQCSWWLQHLLGGQDSFVSSPRIQGRDAPRGHRYGDLPAFVSELHSWDTVLPPSPRPLAVFWEKRMKRTSCHGRSPVFSEPGSL